MQVEKTVFISYRRTHVYMARAVYQYLKANGFDCFLDYESIDAGSFERIILNQIAARAHFVVILTPSAVERFGEPDDWLRREIEYALDNERNIVPLMFEGFRYSDVQKHLTGKLNVLPQYNSLEVPSAYFEEAMTRLQTRFMNKALDVILRPTPPADRQAVADAKAKVEAQPTVTEQRLSAEEWYEQGNKKREAKDYDGAIEDYNEAIRLNSNYPEAYNYRGNAQLAKKNYDSAIADYNEAIRINPKYDKAYNNRGIARNDKGDYDGAIADYNEAILLNPSLAEAYNNRGIARNNKGDYDGAIADYKEAIRLNPKYAEAYNNRGIARNDKGDYDGAIADYNEAIRLNPNGADAYNNRGTLYHNIRKDYDRAIADYETALRINPNDELVKNNLELARKEKAKQRK